MGRKEAEGGLPGLGLARAAHDDYVMTLHAKEEMDEAEWVNGFDYVMTYQRVEWGFFLIQGSHRQICRSAPCVSSHPGAQTGQQHQGSPPALAPVGGVVPHLYCRHRLLLTDEHVYTILRGTIFLHGA